MLEVLNGGMYTTIQDYPGRVGYWDVGIPPSGPMDSLAFRIANRLVKNPEGEAGLEITCIGPELRFRTDAVIALTGARLNAKLDEAEVPWWKAILVKKGSTLTLGGLEGEGFRSYLAVRGGFDVPAYLGSKATFPFGGFGGYEGRPLKPGDTLRVAGSQDVNADLNKSDYQFLEYIPRYTSQWEIGVLPGPHGVPDIFTAQDEEMIFSAAWTVHYNSNRLGYRLEGPRPVFARKDGGEGGQHPSNMLDYTYAIGTVNFTGNTPVILTVDGPSLGGFVSFITIPTAELWKVGQAKAQDTIRFKKMTREEALELQLWQNQWINRI
ncbi:MAG TPA: 5-oxoprolinase/urea amidolyase family protein [Selenomonadales bacterium]|nr:5-oxoprolinase/urea amidolyase family protein [Selenomonadales bacterium]